MKEKGEEKEHLLKPILLYSLKPEEALEPLMRVDPAKVCREMQKLLKRRVR